MALQRKLAPFLPYKIVLERISQCREGLYVLETRQSCTVFLFSLWTFTSKLWIKRLITKNILDKTYLLYKKTMDKTSSSIVHGLLAQFSKKYDSCLVSVNLRKFLWMVDDGQRKLSKKQQVSHWASSGASSSFRLTEGMNWEKLSFMAMPGSSLTV